MNFEFKTILEFNDYFKDELSCYLYLESKWWINGKFCPHCGSIKEPYKVKTRYGIDKNVPAYRCSEKECNLQFTIKTGSIFEGTKIELRKWLHALYLISANKKGISSVRLSEDIGVSQKSCWLMLHKIRSVMNDGDDEKFEGVNQLDETFIGGKNKNRHHDKKFEKCQGRSFKDKTPVLGIINVGSNEIIERQNKVHPNKIVKEKVIIKPDLVKLSVIKNTSCDSITPIVKNQVKENSILLTDEWIGYNALEKNYHRYFVDHNKGQYVDGFITCNKVENFWSNFKRGIISIYNYVKPKHLQKYCFEFQMRYNVKHSKLNEKFTSLINRCFVERVTYLKLTKMTYF